MKKRLSESYEPAAPAAPGAFMPDGSFKEDGGWSHQGPAHALVVALVRQRRAGKVNPVEAVAFIRSTGNVGPFPNVSQWETCSEWWMAQAATSAEAVVKYAGKGWQASVE